MTSLRAGRTGKMGRGCTPKCAPPGFSGDTLALAKPPRAARIVSAEGRPLLPGTRQPNIDIPLLHPNAEQDNRQHIYAIISLKLVVHPNQHRCTPSPAAQPPVIVSEGLGV